MIATMGLLLIGGLVAGAALGLLRFKVFIVIPALSLICILAIGVGIAAQNELLMVALSTAFAAASLQIGYLLGAAIRYIADARRLELLPPAAAPDKRSV